MVKRPTTPRLEWRYVKDADPTDIALGEASRWRHVEDGLGVTVFLTRVGTHQYEWKWVYDGEFSDDSYDTVDEAMRAAERALDLA